MIKTTLKWIGAYLIVSIIIRVGGAVIFGPEAKEALTIIGVIVALFFALWFSRRDETKELVKLPNEQSGTASRLNFKSKSNILKKAGKFALLYFAIVFSSAILSGLLGALALVYARWLYTIVKFAAPVFVYVVFLYFLTQKYSLITSAKLMMYVYAILIVVERIVFLDSSVEQYYSLSEKAFLHLVLPYICLFVFSGVVFLAKRYALRGHGNLL